MRSAILISRIVRAVETGGSVGDCPGLAAQYADAVRALNARLQSTQTALDAGQTSDAVRLMEAEPKLVDEVGALDFHQLGVWQRLCAAHGWESPPAIDQGLVDRILEVYNSSAMLEPALKAYRKAMRTRDERVIVQSLRRLASLDPSNSEWGRDLARGEASLQKALAAEFRAAPDDDRREAVAADLLDDPWSVSPSAEAVAEASAWRNRREAERRGREQAEDLGILREMASGTWNRTQAEATVKHLDLLAEQGTSLNPDDAGFVESLRRRCDDEVRAEAAAARRKDLMEALHAAVERENPDEIRRVMAAPEFLDDPPDEDLLRSARRVVLHAEEERRRKTHRVIAVVVVALASVMGVSGKLYADRRFKAQCEAEAAALETIANGPRAHEALEKALRTLREEKPRIHASAEVSAYEARLETIRKDRDARLGRAQDAIRRLEEAKSGGWDGDAKLFDDQFKAARTEILPEDEDLARRLAEAELDFEKVKGERREAAIAKAKEELTPLLKEAETLSALLRTRFWNSVLERNVRDFRDKAALWKTSHSEVASSEAVQLDAAVVSLDEPEKKSRDAAGALARLHSASNAVELVAARSSLVANYSAFQDVAALRPLPVSADDVSALVAGTLPAQSRFDAFRRKSVPESDFKAFIEEEILWMEETPTFFDVYGIDNGATYVAFSVGGKSKMVKEDRSTSTKKEERCIFTAPRGGNLLDAKENRFCEEFWITRPVTYVETQRLLKPCAELHDVVDEARAPSVNLRRFTASLWKRFDDQIAASSAPSYQEEETKSQKPLTPDRYPAYKRVQMLMLYKNILAKMGEIPDEERLAKKNADILRRMADLAAPVSLADIPDELSWVCIMDERVEKRNADCARFLASLPKTFGAELRTVASGFSRLSEFSFWKAEFAGVLTFEPGRADKCIPLTPGVKPDHPLYVARMKNGCVVLRKLLVHGKAKGTWMIAPGLGNEWIPGEPLFQVRNGEGNLVDADAAVSVRLSSLPESAVAEFKSRPFWIELAFPEPKTSGTGKKEAAK